MVELKELGSRSYDSAAIQCRNILLFYSHLQSPSKASWSGCSFQNLYTVTTVPGQNGFALIFLIV